MPDSPAPTVLLVGELNPYGIEPKYALFDLPEGASGDRLRRLILGVRRSTYYRRFTRYNLRASGR